MRLRHFLSGLAITALVVAGCSGTDGETGPAGEAGEAGEAGAAGDKGEIGEKGEDGEIGEKGEMGEQGEAGAQGEPGVSWQPPQYVGSAKCGECHEAQYDKFLLSGHPYKLNKVVNGEKPTYPYDDKTGGLPDPPLGLTWNDVSYVIGGFGWKARWVGNDGYIVTGEAGDKVQYNFANPIVGNEAGWVAYHAGEKKPYTCGECHTTGWIPCAVGDDTCEHQDGLEGMAGSFNDTGVQCEECHGPGSQHAEWPYLVEAKVDGSPELCGQCHIRSAVEQVDASGGFIKHHEQYEELFAGKKHSMRCVDCHDPHASAKYDHPDINPNKGIRVACQTCHINYDNNQKSTIMQNTMECIDCHMPRIVKSAVGDASKWTGDIRTHFFAINPDETQSQFTEDGKFANPWVSLDYACRSCHREGGTAQVKTDAELGILATGYHTAE